MLRSVVADTADRTDIREIADLDEWNWLVSRFQGHRIEQSFEWGEIHRQAGWEPHRYAVYDGFDCVAVLPIMARRLPMLRRSVLFASLLPMTAKSETPWAGLLAAASCVAERTRAIVLRLSLGGGEAAAHGPLLRAGFAKLPPGWTTAPSLGAIARFDAAGGAAPAPKSSLSVRPVATSRHVETLHALFPLGAPRAAGPPPSLRYLDALWRQYVARSNGVGLLAERGGTVLGGLLAVRFYRTAYVLEAGVTRAGGTEAAAVLRGELNRWASRSGCRSVAWGRNGAALLPPGLRPGRGTLDAEARAAYDLVFRPGPYRAFRMAEGRLPTWTRGREARAA